MSRGKKFIQNQDLFSHCHASSQTLLYLCEATITFVTEVRSESNEQMYISENESPHFLQIDRQLLLIGLHLKDTSVVIQWFIFEWNKQNTKRTAFSVHIPHMYLICAGRSSSNVGIEIGLTCLVCCPQKTAHLPLWSFAVCPGFWRGIIDVPHIPAGGKKKKGQIYHCLSSTSFLVLTQSAWMRTKPFCFPNIYKWRGKPICAKQLQA